MKDRAPFTFQLDKSMNAFLEEMVKKYRLPDTSKAVRCLLNFARERGDQQDEIFARIRCLEC